MPQARRRIVILGGGVGALGTAWHLTQQADWQQHYEVVVYQMGWRLGGKGASSRNAKFGGRIQEHGLHVWFGFYENAFAMMRACYADAALPPNPLYDMDTAFRGRDFLCMMEQWKNQWSLWPLELPVQAGEPGTRCDEPSAWLILRDLVGLLTGELKAHLHEIPTHELPRTAQALPVGVGAALPASQQQSPLHLAHDLLHGLASGLHPHAAHVGLLDSLMNEFRDWARARWEHLLDGSPKLRRLLEVLELGSAMLLGILADELIGRGLSSIDHLEFRDWLARHGARAFALDSSVLRGLYDCCFAYEGGDVSRPNFAAGAALGCALRIGLSYRGHVLYEMGAGMGDVVVTPLYRVLAARGVRFEFFQRVKSLELSDDGKRIARVRFGRQTTLRNGPYQPLQDLPGIAQPVWPDHPLYEQIVEGAALRAQDIDLESHWTPWPDIEEWALELAPSDQLVLGISLGALEPICRQLAKADPRWRQLLDEVPSTQTQSMQLWLNKTSKELGWTMPVATMVAAPEVFDVWADMSHLLAQEAWPAQDSPRSLQYFCGPLQGDFLHQSPDDPTVPTRAAAQVRVQTIAWLQQYASRIWPESAHGQAFDWSLLYAADECKGEARLDAQYLRANIDPSERYVLSPAGGNLRRLSPEASGFDNLVLAGDWTRTPINAGCVEAAVMSGMAASRALCGYPKKICGEHFLQG